MPARLSPTVTSAWARLARAHRSLIAEVDRDLKAAGLAPLAWYDVLLELTRTDAESATPRDLQHECLLEQYNISRLLDRMQAQGLVKRQPYPGDKRRQLVEITDQGRAMQKRMWPVYAATIQRRLGDKLSDRDIERLADLLGALIEQGSEARDVR